MPTNLHVSLMEIQQSVQQVTLKETIMYVPEAKVYL